VKRNRRIKKGGGEREKVKRRRVKKKIELFLDSFSKKYFFSKI
jgi:hypothetical protein